MTEIKRPVFFSGENPGITLYTPQTEQVAAVASYWYCTDSPLGVGHALVLWIPNNTPSGSMFRPGGIFTDNIDLARAVVNNLTHYFPEFRGIPVATLAYNEAICDHSYDGENYKVICQTKQIEVQLEWSDVLDRKQVLWPNFPAGTKSYDLTTVICPCRSASILLNGSFINGEVRAAKSADGHFSSSAFLAFAETWIGPL